MRRSIAIAMILAIPLCCTGQADKPSERTDTDAAVKLDPQGKAKKPSVWMKQKLSLTQQIFAGLTQGDMIKVKESAQQLKLINRLESFVRGRSPAYAAQLKLFQFANDEILEGAQEENLEQATLAYTQLSISCISCHKRLRKPR